MESYVQLTLSVDFISCWVVLTQCVFASYWVTVGKNCRTVNTLVLPYLLVEGWRELLWDISFWADWSTQKKKGNKKNNTHLLPHKIWMQAFIRISFWLSQTSSIGIFSTAI